MSQPITLGFRDRLRRDHRFKQHPYFSGAWFEENFHQDLRISVMNIRSYGIAKALAGEIRDHFPRYSEWLFSHRTPPGLF